MPSRAAGQVSGSFQSNAGSAARDATRVATPRARSRSVTRRPVLPVPPRTRVAAAGVHPPGPTVPRSDRQLGDRILDHGVRTWGNRR